MKTINRNGIKFELVTIITTLYQAAIPATFDEEQNELTPEVPEIPEVTEDIETGRIVGIEVEIPSNSNLSIPNVRKIELLSLVEEIDLEMIIQSRINYYNQDGTKLMSEVIDEDETLSSEAKMFQKRLFRSYTLLPKSTRDSYVNPETGELLEAGNTNGIREVQYYQNLTKSNLEQINPNLSEENRLQFLRAYMLVYVLKNIYERTGI